VSQAWIIIIIEFRAYLLKLPILTFDGLIVGVEAMHVHDHFIKVSRQKSVYVLLFENGWMAQIGEHQLVDCRWFQTDGAAWFKARLAIDLPPDGGHINSDSFHEKS